MLVSLQSSRRCRVFGEELGPLWFGEHLFYNFATISISNIPAKLLVLADLCTCALAYNCSKSS
jgi:hypothetical protein